MVLLSFSGVILLVLAVRNGDKFHLPFAIFFCAAMAWNWYVFLGIPYEIRFDGPHRLSFRSLRNTRTVSAEELQSIEPIRGGSGFYMLRYDGGRIRLLSQFTGFHEVISKMKAANPNFKVVGI